MKLISLNVWEGQILEPLKNFIKNYSKEVDIFCFQEILKGEEFDLFELIQNILPGFQGYFTEQVSGIGLATFVRETVGVEKIDSFSILSSEEVKNADGVLHYYPRRIQVITLKNISIEIFNFHGIPGSLKRDTGVRKLQTKRLQEILEKYAQPKILVGDFNLSPDTNAISALEENLINLMKGTTFKTTRTKFYDKREVMPFADYIFISSTLKINDFGVLPDEVSDHSPLLLDFEI